MSFILKSTSASSYSVTNLAEDDREVSFEGQDGIGWVWSNWTAKEGSTVSEEFDTLELAVRDAECEVVCTNTYAEEDVLYRNYLLEVGI